MNPRTIYTDPQWIDSVSLWLVNEETWVDGVCVVRVRHWDSVATDFYKQFSEQQTNQTEHNETIHVSSREK